MSGIFRDVSLLHKPDIHLRDIHISTHLSPEFSSAHLEVMAAVNIPLLDINNSQVTKAYQIRGSALASGFVSRQFATAPGYSTN